VVRFSESTLAVLCAGAEQVAVRSAATKLAAVAQKAHIEVWCGYGAMAPTWGVSEILGAAEAALAYAQRAAPGTVIG
jgi:hypothetical protein